MNGLLHNFELWLAGGRGLAILKAAVMIVLGFAVGQLASRLARRLAGRYMNVQKSVLIRRGVFYGIMVVAVVAALHQVGFKIGVLLGTAGVLSVAFGFAAQTSASNLISGLFLIGEQSFTSGDTIKVGDMTGEVLSVDLLSVKLRTFDNLYVRVPNETLIKSDITNLTRFPLRRIDLHLRVAYKEDLARVRALLVAIADHHPLCLYEPRPQIVFEGFGESSLNVQFSVWATRENFTEAKNTIAEDIKRSFDAEGIEIPFPQRSVHVVRGMEALPPNVAADEDRDGLEEQTLNLPSP